MKLLPPLAPSLRQVVTLVDLAGHEKYFKTTAYGLTGHMPDYACLVVGANAGQPGYWEATRVGLPENVLLECAV